MQACKWCGDAVFPEDEVINNSGWVVHSNCERKNSVDDEEEILKDE